MVSNFYDLSPKILFHSALYLLIPFKYTNCCNSSKILTNIKKRLKKSIIDDYIITNLMCKKKIIKIIIIFKSITNYNNLR